MTKRFVDFDAGLSGNGGTSVADEWLLAPGQTGASSQTGYALSAGDVISIQAGSETDLRLPLPADNLRYIKHGSSSPLTLTLPDPANPASTVTRAVGSGMWKVDEPAMAFPILSFGARSGCVVEDAHIVGSATNADATVKTGFSNAVGARLTLRRSKVSGGLTQGIGGYTTSQLIEDVVVEDVGEDAITLGANALNNYRAGTTDIIRRVCIINPGADLEAALGDAFQTFATSERFESTLILEDIYVYKPSPVKQAMALSDLLGGGVLRRFHFDGGGTGTVQVVFSGLGGKFTVENGYMGNTGGAGNAAFRFTGVQGIEAGAQLTIRNVIATDQRGGLFAWGASESACTIDGSVLIEDCYVDGEFTQDFSFTAALSCHPGALVTIGAGASWIARNNIVMTTGKPAVRLPSSGANDPRFVVQNNTFLAGSTYAIGSTIYNTLAEFEAAHSYATGNRERTLAELQLDANYRPAATSPIIGTGASLGYRLDASGRLRDTSEETPGAFVRAA